MGVKVDEGQTFVTKVNYEGLYQLRNDHSKYMKLVEAIRLKIESQQRSTENRKLKKAFD